MTVYLPSTSETDLYKIVLSLQQLGAGRSNATGTVTLAAGATTTTVAAQNCAATSIVLMFPATANAAAAVASTYVSSITKGQFIVTHPNNANTDKTFFWVALG